MARNAERQSAMLNRWLLLPSWMRTPRPAEEAETPSELRETLRDMGRKIMDIQNASLGEARIRELNDEINRLIRVKNKWEARLQSQSADVLGSEVIGQDGYFYFGAARNLPGVREVLERQRAEKHGSAGASNVKRGDLYKRANAEYYGFRDEENPSLLLAEQAREDELRGSLVEEWCRSNGVANG